MRSHHFDGRIFFRALGAPLWEPTRPRAFARAFAWHLRGAAKLFKWRA